MSSVLRSPSNDHKTLLYLDSDNHHVQHGSYGGVHVQPLSHFEPDVAPGHSSETGSPCGGQDQPQHFTRSAKVTLNISQGLPLPVTLKISQGLPGSPSTLCKICQGLPHYVKRSATICLHQLVPRYFRVTLTVSHDCTALSGQWTL